jgi:hypothetical protein
MSSPYNLDYWEMQELINEGQEDVNPDIAPEDVEEDWYDHPSLTAAQRNPSLHQN